MDFNSVHYQRLLAERRRLRNKLSNLDKALIELIIRYDALISRANAECNAAVTAANAQRDEAITQRDEAITQRDAAVTRRDAAVIASHDAIAAITSAFEERDVTVDAASRRVTAAQIECKIANAQRYDAIYEARYAVSARNEVFILLALMRAQTKKTCDDAFAERDAAKASQDAAILEMNAAIKSEDFAYQVAFCAVPIMLCGVIALMHYLF